MGSTNSIICAFGFLGFIIAILDYYSLSLSVTPLSGTRQSTQPPSPKDYSGPTEFSRLLDVGACSSMNDSGTFISNVPPLDGTSPDDTTCLAEYGMKFVLFDLQLINLEAFDAIAGSFTVELQMVLHWKEYSNATGFSPPQRKDNCSFVCDTTSADPFCCEDIWVPPLELPGCTINAIQSVTPTPYLVWKYNVSGTDVWFLRRFWYLNIDAKCAAKPDFHNFPFDAQKLTIDVINPYASRTWFQLNKGFLKQNVGLGLAGIDLDPDRKSAGWNIKNLLVSSSCGTQQSWQQTFLTQDYLLSIISNQTPTKKYMSQRDSIMDSLNPEKSLKCAEMKSVEVSTLKEMLSNPADLLPYETTEKDYEERFNSTLQHYRDCVESSGYSFYLNTTASGIEIPGVYADFNLSQLNINRSFGLLDLHKDQQPTKVSFKCAIAAVANLTTPGIRITILVQRFRTFYVVKLVVPAVACVLFAFSAFGLEPDDLMGRLTVVVPSAIALTALQALVVATDIPAVAYIAPTTYIMILSYIVQLLIAFESVLMNRWLKKQNNCNSSSRVDVANEALDRQSNEIELPSRARGPSDGQQDNTSLISASNALTAGEPKMPRTHPMYMKIRKYDIWVMKFFAAVYILAFLLCVFVPFFRSTRMKRTVVRQSTTMWD